MDSSVEGVEHDSSKCRKLTLDEKREITYALSKQPLVATEMLQSWSRQELLQILCAEMGKERKYTGLTKAKIIETLLKIVSEKESGEQKLTTGVKQQSSPATAQNNSKRQRKIGNGVDDAIYCKNSACRAMLRREAAFCKRCSCCICYKYDDNKDPSLWLTCSSEPPFDEDSCSMSCHLECALKHEKSGIPIGRQKAGLDGSFFCVSCGKPNDLLGCWRKQLMVAKDTRRVDILCYRVFLGHKLLKGTKKYQKLSEIINEAVNMLEADVGPLTGSPVKTARGIVNRLSSGPEVQKLCSFAMEFLDKMLPDIILQSQPNLRVQGNAGNEKNQDMLLDSNSINSTGVRFEEVLQTSVAVILGSEEPSSGTILGYHLWHRKVNDVVYPIKATCTVYAPNTRYTITGLAPATEYYLKVVSFNGTGESDPSEIKFSTSRSNKDEFVNDRVVGRTQSPAAISSSLSNPSSVEDESFNITYFKKSEKNVPANLSSDDHNRTLAGEGENITEADSTLDEEHPVDGTSLEPNSDVLKLENKRFLEGRIVEETSTDDDGSDTRVETGFMDSNNGSEDVLPITPCKSDTPKDSQAHIRRSKSDMKNGKTIIEEHENGSTSKKTNRSRQNKEYAGNGVSDADFEHCVKVIRGLECDEHIDRSFRQRFLTWYSLRATRQEVRVVKVFIDTFMEDPASLAEQLVDTFSESILSKRSAFVPAGICLKLWH